jgi:hypothetical protein
VLDVISYISGTGISLERGSKMLHLYPLPIPPLQHPVWIINKPRTFPDFREIHRTNDVISNKGKVWSPEEVNKYLNFHFSMKVNENSKPSHCNSELYACFLGQITGKVCGWAPLNANATSPLRGSGFTSCSLDQVWVRYETGRH